MKRLFSLMLTGTLIVSALLLPAGAAGTRFSDVPASHWASGSIEYAVEKGYFSGTSSTTFSPEGSMTRAMLWMVLSRMDGYTGTAASGAPWYQAGRDWATANGISDGTNPDGSITREQFAAMLYNFARHTGAAAEADAAVLNKFADRGSVASYAVDAMAWAVNHGIISGTSSTTVSPAGLATRSQAAAMLMRFDQMGEDEPSAPSTPAVDYKTVFAAINVPPYPGDTIKVGEFAYVSIASNPYGANVKAGVTYTVTSSDPSVAAVNETFLNPSEVSFSVSGLKAGTVTLTAIGSDGYKGTTTITVKGIDTPTTPTVDTSQYAELKAEVVRLINEERSRLGLHTLAVSDKIMQAAQIRAHECADWKFSHTRPDGTSYSTVFIDVALPSGGGEIIAYGYRTAQDVVNAWAKSPGHYKTMIQDNYNFMGIGISRDFSGTLYYSAMFASIGE